MAEPADGIEMRDFPGLVKNTEPRDVPPGGAEEQINACSLVVGELTVRHGYRMVQFDDA
jgi:hypothetical protein